MFKNNSRFKVSIPFLNSDIYLIDVVLSVLISSIVFILALITKSFWGDEILSIRFSSQHLPNLVNNLSLDYHPPVYFLLLKVWIAIAGNSEILLRAFQGLQDIFFILLSLLLFRRSLPGYRYHPFWILLISSSELWLFMPMLRYYTLAASLVIFSSLVFLRWLENNNRSSTILLLISYILLLYTDYPASIIIVHHFIYILFKNRSLIRKLIIIDFISILFFSPWIFVITRQINKLINWHQTADLNTSAWVIPIKIGYGLYSFIFGEMIFPFEIFAIVTGLVIFIAVLFSFPKFKELSRNDNIKFALGPVVIGLLFTSVITTFISTHTSFIYTPSRTFFALPFLFLFGGGFYSIMKKEIFRKLIILVFLLINIYGISNWILNRHFLMPVYATPWKEVLSDLNGNEGIILVDESLCYKYYQNMLRGVYPVFRNPQTISELTNDAENSFSKNHSRNIFLIIMGRESTKVELNKDVIDYIQTKGTKLFEKKYLIQDESYKKIKSRILKRNSYDAKLTLFKYELRQLPENQIH